MRDFLEITGGYPLVGGVDLHGAKNAVLPMLAAAVLTPEPVTVTDCPFITDVDNMMRVLEGLGLAVTREGRSITVAGSPTLNYIPPHLACAMRSSVFMLGALLSVTGEVRLFNPGGCNIGARPLDIHLNGLIKMGAKVEYGGDYVYCTAEKLRGAEIILKYPSVGATENLMITAAGAEGVTKLVGVAREPEIVSLAALLRAMGAKISGEGSPVLTVTGVDSLSGAVCRPAADRIVAGTVLAAVAATGGRVEVGGACGGHLGALTVRLASPHSVIIDHGGSLEIISDGRVVPGDAATGPYPLFPTDMQAPFMACKCLADGVSRITETVFEHRFAHVAELLKAGADVSVDGNVATVTGGRLHGADMCAADLRGGAGLAVAAMAADGTSRLRGLEYIDRGYERIEDIFSGLGAKMARLSV